MQTWKSMKTWQRNTIGCGIIVIWCLMCIGVFLVMDTLGFIPESTPKPPTATEIVIITNTTIPPTEPSPPTWTPPPTNTPVPSLTPIGATAWVVMINCPECGELQLTLWEYIDDIGQGGGKVSHGDICTVIDQGVTEGIEKVKVTCNGNTGWIRAEGVAPVTVEPQQTPLDAQCNCYGPDRDCPSFFTRLNAQTCYDYCKSLGLGDVFGLDGDGDGRVCEDLP